MVATSSPPRTRAEQAVRAYARYGLASATLLLAVIAERWLLARHTFPADPWGARLGGQMIASHRPWAVWAITRIYQQVGRPLVAIGEVLVMFAWLWRTSGRRAAQGLVIVLLASATCGLIKIICGPTPFWMALDHVGTNFPSGVVTFMTATIGYVGVAAWRGGRRALALTVLLAILGAGPARVIGGQHLPSDVLGGYMLGIAWLLPACVYLFGGGRSDAGSRARVPAAWQLRAEDLAPEGEAKVGVEPARA